MVHLLTVIILFGMMAGLTYVPGAEATKMTAAVGFVLVAAFSIGELAKRAGLPALLGYIVAGILFGPSMAELLVGADGAITDWIRHSYGTETVVMLFGADEAATLLPSAMTEGGLGYVETLTVGVIGTLGGGELVLDDLKDQIGTIIAVCAAFFLLIVPITAGAVYGMTVYTPGLVPFLEGAPTTTVLGVALLFGVFGFAMSPAATLAIIQETRSKGSFTSLVLGIVIVADVVLVASFLLTQAFAGILIKEGTVALAPILAALPSIGAEFGWALVVGALTGLIFIAYFRFVAREMLFFTVGAIFVASFVCDIVHAEKLLAFLTAGFLVQNVSEHGHDMIEALESISMPVFVVYFTIKAAELNLQGVASYMALVGILTAIRTATLYGGVNLIARYFRSNLPDKVQDNLWLSFFSRGGVDLVLASLLAEKAATLGDWTIAFQNVIMGIVAIHLVAGPALLKFALDRAGESADQQPSSDGPEPETAQPESPDPDAFVGEPFPEPSFASPELQSRVADLRSQLTTLHEQEFVRPIEEHDDTVRHFVDRVNEQVHEATDDLIGLIRTDAPADERAAQIRSRHQQFRQSLQTQFDLVKDLRPAPVTTDTCDAVLDTVRDMEPFESVYRVEVEPHLLETNPTDGPSTRIIKWTRKAYSTVMGSMTRTVPLGRLWRFYIELSLPEFLVSATEDTAETHEEFWWQLGAQLRQVDRLFERVIELLRQQARGSLERELASDVPEDSTDDTETAEHDEPLDLPIAPADEAGPFRQAPILDDIFSAEFDDPDAVADSSFDLEAKLVRTVGAVRDALSSEAERLRQLRTQYTQESLESMTRALQRGYLEFLQGAEEAGTIQLPAFRYRPSIKFDQAERAEKTLKQRLRAEQRLISGFRGWMVADQQVILFLHWFHNYEDRVLGALNHAIRQNCLQALRDLEDACEARPDGFTDLVLDEAADEPTDNEPHIDWSQWLQKQLKPSVQRTRSILSTTLNAIGEGDATQRLLDILETRVGQFSDSVPLLGTDISVPSHASAPGDIAALEVPLREWFMADLIRDSALRYVELNERLERSIRRSLVTLEDVEQVLDNNLDPDPQSKSQTSPAGEPPANSADELADRGLRRAAERLAELADSLDTDSAELNDWISSELRKTVRRTTRPILRGEVNDIPAQLEQRQTTIGEDASDGRLAALTRPISDGIDAIWNRAQPAIQEITTDLSHRLTGYRETVTQDDVRTRLQTLDTSNLDDIPVVYRRLFTPVPMDIPDFYVQRESLEAHCLDCIDRWFRGETGTMLLYGDRGTGKRTLLHHLLPVELRNHRELHENQVEHFRLGETLEKPQDFCRRLASLDGISPTDSLSSLRRELRSMERKRIIVIEDGDNLLSRTPNGVELGRTLFDFFNSTADDVLWLVTMGRPAVTLFDTLLNLTNFFTHTYELDPIDRDDMRQMIRSRHRVSGFHLEFLEPNHSVVERLRHPIRTAEARGDPREAYFEQLRRLSRGNPMLGLLYWLQSVRLDPQDNTQFLVDPLPDDELELLEPLTRTQLMLVATLVQHRRLRRGLIAEVLQMPESEVETELGHLRRLGFIRQSPGKRTTWELRPFAEALTTPMLREANLV